MSLGTILTAVVTPFGNDGKVDEDAFVAHVQHVCATGSDGIVVAGTGGEAPTLSVDEHVALLELAVRERPPGATVVAGVGSNDTRHAVFMTERACEIGVDGLLSVTPYYNRPSFRGIRAHYAEVSKAADRPILLYNIPHRTGLDLPNELLAELGQLDHVEGVKQANPANLAPIDGLDLYCGDDDQFARTLDMGGVGGVLTASQLVGERFRAMVDATPEERATIQAELAPLNEALSVTPLAVSIKAALDLLGRPVGDPRLPYVAADEQERATIRGGLERMGLLVAAG